MTKVESQASRCTFCFEALEAFFQVIIFGCSNPLLFVCLFKKKKNLFTKNLHANAGDTGLIPVPWRRKWQPTQVFLPGEPMDRGSYWAIGHGLQEADMT